VTTHISQKQHIQTSSNSVYVLYNLGEVGVLGFILL